MNARNTPIITELDAARIRELAARLPDRGKGLGPLQELMELVTEHAQIVPGRRIAPDVVTVNSTASFRDEVTLSVHKVTVVYPQDVSIPQRRISVLSPVGRALLGLVVGGTAAVDLPDGSTRDIRIVELHYQPEAAGDYMI